MNLLPDDIVRTIGNRLGNGDLGSVAKASRTMRGVLGPEADAREQKRVLDVLARARRETEPIDVVLTGTTHYYSFVLSFSGSTGTLKFGKNKKFNWQPRLESCTFSAATDGRSLSMAQARAVAEDVLKEVFRGRTKDACRRVESSGDPAFVAAIVMTYAFDLLMKSRDE